MEGIKFLNINVIKDTDQLEDMRDTWNSILFKSADNEIFLTWEWLTTWWKHYGKDSELNILTVKKDDKVIAIAPLMRSKHQFVHFGSIEKIEFIGSPHSDYNAFIILENETKCLKLFFNYLLNECSDWDYLELRDVAENTLTAKLLHKIAFKRNLKERLTDLCLYVNVPTSTELYMKMLSSSMRYNLRRSFKKIQKSHNVEFKSHKAFNTIEKAMKVFVELHQNRWHSVGELGAFSKKGFRDFHSDLAVIFDEKGWLSLSFLTADDVPIASLYTFDYHQKKYMYLSGYDSVYYEFGPGKLLLHYAIEQSIRNGFEECDFMRGYEPYKAQWGTRVRKNYVFQLIRTGFYSNLYDLINKNILYAKIKYYYLARKHGYAIKLARNLGLV